MPAASRVKETVGDTQLRWEMIRGSSLTLERSRNLLDLGCNIGDLTALAAEPGVLSTLGVDIGKPVDSGSSAEAPPRISVLCSVCRRAHFSEDDRRLACLRRLPLPCLCTIIGIVSMVRDAAAEMLRTLLKKTNHAMLFFEPPSRRKRYGHGDSRPAFKSNDEDSVVAYHQGMLVTDALGDAAEIEYLGNSPLAWGIVSLFGACS